MNGKLYEAFDNIRADEELKQKTRAYLAQKTNGYAQKRKTARVWRLAVAAACCLMLCLGVHSLYFTPTVEISIDINPSIELGINRFDRVISVEGYNEDGKELAESLDLTFLRSAEAVDCLLESDTIATLLAEDAVLSVAVVGSDDAQCDRVLSEVQACTAEEPNAHCYKANAEEVEHAHDVGLSFGKYQAYLEAAALDPSITPEEIAQMTMREIRDLIASLSGETADDAGTNASGSGSGYGAGNGADCENDSDHGAGSGNGSGSGSGSGDASGSGNGSGAGSGSGTGSQGAGHHGEGKQYGSKHS